MFSIEQKKMIAKKIEEVLLSFNHLEMPKEFPVFRIKVWGKESWSWADIVPNWTFNNKKPTINPFNEMQGSKL